MSAVRVYPVDGVLAIGALVVSALFMLRVVQHTCYGPPLEKFADLQDITAALGRAAHHSGVGDRAFRSLSGAAV